jgi:hypothetical protein
VHNFTLLSIGLGSSAAGVPVDPVAPPLVASAFPAAGALAAAGGGGAPFFPASGAPFLPKENVGFKLESY